MARQLRARGSKFTTKNWTATTWDDNLVTVTQSLIGTVQISGADETLLRVRGAILCNFVPDAATDTDIIALGMILANIAAINVGGASLPGPIADASANWLWHEFVPIDANGATAAGGAAGTLQQFRVVVDSKAMRKVPAGYGIAVMAELATGDFASVNVTGGVRMLFGH